jgi:hypothetical protein
MKTSGPVVAVLFGKGGLGDVGRHAVLAALERENVSTVKVLSQNIETLEEKNWKCGCPEDHEFTEEQRNRLELVSIKDNWKDISMHLSGVDAVVSCLGTRQPFLGGRCATRGSKAVAHAMKNHGISRVVSITSMGLNEDYPSMEFHWAGKIMDGIFATVSRREANDLKGSEKVYRESDLDYLLVRPMGLAEDLAPSNEWFVQKQKHKDVVGTNISKMDCGRFMVEEALNPTRHRMAVVVGGDPEKDDMLKDSQQRKAEQVR